MNYVAFLRGINVGKNTLLPMARLKAICEKAGLISVRTFIASGNVMFESAASEEELIRLLESALETSEGRRIPVIIRQSPELKKIVSRNPFPDANPAQVGVMLFAKPVPKDLMEGVVISGPEQVKISGREIFIHYPLGMGRSKLKIPAQDGTVRNINTIRKLAELFGEKK